MSKNPNTSPSSNSSGNNSSANNPNVSKDHNVVKSDTAKSMGKAATFATQFEKDISKSDKSKTEAFLNKINDIKIEEYTLDNSNKNALESRREFLKRKELYENRGIFGILTDKIKSASAKALGRESVQRESDNGMRRGFIKALKNTFNYDLAFTRVFNEAKIQEEVRNSNYENGISEVDIKYAKAVEKSGIEGEKVSVESMKSKEVDDIKYLALENINALNSAKNKEEKKKALEEARKNVKEYKDKIKKAYESSSEKNSDIDLSQIELLIENVATLDHKVSLEAINNFFDQKLKTKHYQMGDIYSSKDNKISPEKVNYVAAQLGGKFLAGSVGVGLIYAAGKFIKQPIKAALGAFGGGAVIGAYSGYKFANRKISDDNFSAEISANKSANLGKNSKKYLPEGKKVSDLLKDINYERVSIGDEIIDEHGNKIKVDKESREKINHERFEKQREAVAEAKARLEIGAKNRQAFLIYDSIESAKAQKLELLEAILKYESSQSKNAKKQFDKTFNKAVEKYSNEAKDVKKGRAKFIAKSVVTRAIIGGTIAAGLFEGAKKVREYLSNGSSTYNMVDKDYLSHYGDKTAAALKAEELKQAIASNVDNSNIPVKASIPKVVSSTVFFDKIGNTIKHLSRTWEKNPTVHIGKWHISEHKGYQFYEISLRALKGQNINELDGIISDGKNLIKLDISDGKIRIPVSSSLGKTLFSVGKNGEPQFNANTLEVGKIGKNGDAHIMSTISGLGKIKKYILSNGGKESIPVPTKEFTQIGDPNSVLKDVGDINLAGGRTIDLYSMDKGISGENPFFSPDKHGAYDFGTSLHELNATANEDTSRLFANISNSPEQLSLWSSIFKSNPDLKNMSDINEYANILGQDKTKYFDQIQDLNGQLSSLLKGGNTRFVDLNHTGYSRSFYQYLSSDGDIVLGSSKINPGAGGLAIELLDKNGKNIFSGDILARAKELLGVNPAEKGRILVRTDCGGQIIWVKDGVKNVAKNIINNTKKVEEIYNITIEENTIIINEGDTIIEDTTIINEGDIIIDNDTIIENDITNTITEEVDNNIEVPSGTTEVITPKDPQELIDNQTPEIGNIAPTNPEDILTESPLTETSDSTINNSFSKVQEQLNSESIPSFNTETIVEASPDNKITIEYPVGDASDDAYPNVSFDNNEYLSGSPSYLGQDDSPEDIINEADIEEFLKNNN